MQLSGYQLFQGVFSYTQVWAAVTSNACLSFLLESRPPLFYCNRCPLPFLPVV